MIPLTKPYLGKSEAKSACRTILTGWITQGPKIREFEERFAAYVGSKYAVAVSNCTTALHLSMITSGISHGDEVICPSLSFIASANCILYVGAKPVFAEIDPETYNIDPNQTEKLINKKTKAILLVHQMGMPADIDAFRKLSRKYNLVLIEDAACAIGSEYNEKKIGRHSDLVAFSFHPRKVITTGEGGMIATSNKKYYQRLRILRQHGMSVSDTARHHSKKVIFEKYLELGYNYKMTDFQAAIGIEQLKKIDWIILERRKIANRYNQAFKRIPCIRIPVEKKGCYTNYQSYCIYLDKNAPVSRNDLMQRLLDEGIATRRGIMTIHRETAYGIFCKGLSLPVSEDVSDRSIILPLYAGMPNSEVETVIKAIKKYLLN